MTLPTVWALRPTRVINRNLGSIEISRCRSGIPLRMSSRLAARILPLLPMYQGTIFQSIVRCRGIPAATFNSNQFFAVSSGLFLETNPLATARGPGASNTNRHSASMPPSSGSKYGTITSPDVARSSSTKSVSRAMCWSRSSNSGLSFRHVTQGLWLIIQGRVTSIHRNRMTEFRESRGATFKVDSLLWSAPECNWLQM